MWERQLQIPDWLPNLVAWRKSTSLSQNSVKHKVRAVIYLELATVQSLLLFLMQSCLVLQGKGNRSTEGAYALHKDSIPSISS